MPWDASGAKNVYRYDFYSMNHLLNTGYIAWTCLLLLIACHHKKTPIHDSVDSPMAQALLKKEVGDEVIVKTPASQFKWRINKIEYQK